MANTISVFHNGTRNRLRADEASYLRKCAAMGPLSRRPPSALVYLGLVGAYDGDYGAWEVTARGYGALALAEATRR